MKKFIQEIIQDLYDLDPSLKQQEAMLLKTIQQLLAARPNIPYDEKFKQELRQVLLEKIEKQMTTQKIQPRITRKSQFNWENLFGVTKWAFAMVVLVVALAAGLNIYKDDNKTATNQSSPDSSKVTTKNNKPLKEEDTPDYAPHEKPQIEDTSNYALYQIPQTEGQGISSSEIDPAEFSIKNELPEAQKVIDQTKKQKKLTLLESLSFLLPINRAFANDLTILPIFPSIKEKLTEAKATEFASRLGFTGKSQKEGSDEGYYAFNWKKDNENLSVNIGGFTYELKGNEKTGEVLEGKDAINSALDFLRDKKIAQGNFYEAFVVGDIDSRAKVGGSSENKNQIYFKKSLEGLPIHEWEKAERSPRYDQMEVWTGANGRVIYADNNSYWTNPNLKNKKNFYLKETNEAFEEIKNGKGRIAWLDMKNLGFFNGQNPEAPPSNFKDAVKVKKVEMKEVNIAYFHDERLSENNNWQFGNYYIPIYIFKADVMLHYNEDYNKKNNGMEDTISKEMFDGKKTEMYFIISALKEPVENSDTEK